MNSTKHSPSGRTSSLGCVQITASAVEKVGLQEIASALNDHQQERASVHYVTLWAGGGDDYLVSSHLSTGGVKFRVARNLTKGITKVRLASEC